ncbi:facilitated trehalose transporter Tret1-like [Cydia fagiglandana]|uniref:facilitated trehalose transporter Tret1-like n=1 Tax=Cydia fagiglandana TaxID=1458189 RepID=UPI002FEDEE76
MYAHLHLYVFIQCFVTSSVCCSVISSCGCGMGFPAVLLPQLQGPGSSIPITQDQASWIGKRRYTRCEFRDFFYSTIHLFLYLLFLLTGSVEMLPMFLGNFVVPAAMARAGRRAAHLAVIIVTLISWAIFILATSYEAMLVARILQGAVSGMMMPLRSVLVSECSSPLYRGAFLTTVSLAQIMGIMLVHLIGTLLSYQMTALVSMSFSIIALIMTVCSPETPSWLATRGRHDECRKNFMWLRSQEELQELENMILATKLHESNENHQLKIFAFAKREFYKPILLMSALFSMVSFTIGTLMVVYPIPLLNVLMSSDANTSAWMVALDVQSIMSSIVAVYAVHKIKRRTLLFITGALCVGTQTAIAAYAFAKAKDYLPFDTIWIPGTLVSTQMICLYIGVIPLGPVIAGEVFPLRFRSYSESISLLSLFVTVFGVLKTFPDLCSAVGVHGTLALYCIVIVACMAVVGMLLPETSGRTLQQIEEHFREGGRLLPNEADIKENEPLNRSQSPVKQSA